MLLWDYMESFKQTLNEQCREVETTIEWEKTGDVFKKIKDIKGIFHGRTGTIKDRNSWELTEAKEIKKW